MADTDTNMVAGRSASVEPDSPIPVTAPTSPMEGTSHGNGAATGVRNASGSISGRLRSASKSFVDSRPPAGMWSATGQAAAKAPSLAEIRRGSYHSTESSGRRSSVGNAGRPHYMAESPAIGSAAAGRARAGTAQSGRLSRDPASPALSHGLGSPIATETGRSSVTEQKKQDVTTTTGPNDENDGFPDLIFGRERIQGQSYDMSKRTNRRESAVPVVASALETDDEYDDLDDLDPTPMRKSKNMQSYFGADAVNASSADGQARKTALTTTPAGTRISLLTSSQVNKATPINTAAAHVPTRTSTSPSPSSNEQEKSDTFPDETGHYPNGYRFPAPKTWMQSTAIGAKALWKFTLTPLGFLIVIYGLNVVAWGAMLFFLLLNASPWMCQLGNPVGGYDCNDIDSPRRVWVEIDSQILTALFCVTAFGLAPWRFRDLWYWGEWRLARNPRGLRRLAGYKRSWLRLAGSQTLSANLGPASSDAEWAKVGIPIEKLDEKHGNASEVECLPVHRKSIPDPPLTGVRAPTSAYWKMDFVVWSMIWNTLFQIVLCFFMWYYNRYTRPSWATGLFVALGCIVAACGGLMEFFEGKRVKKVEGIPLEVAETVKDIETGAEARVEGKK